MLKKITVWALAVLLALGAAAAPLSVGAEAADEETVLETIRALGIITGDENGNLNLSSNVTRAEFAKMMIAGSKYRSTVGSASASSPFPDVPYTHWAASYVQAAVNAGWLVGYTDGTYKPTNNVTTAEAATAVLRMLGYTASDFQGAYPRAQMELYYALELNENISAGQSECLTRRQCMYLFYNLMRTKTTSGSYYAAGLGYTVNSSGELDYSALVEAGMKGPYIASDTSWSSTLPFSASVATVYLNGASVAASSVGQYDVYYYNANLHTVWAYRSRASGVITAVSPSTAAPTSVTIAGKSYTLSASSAAYAVSDLGTFRTGDTVTLLLGRNSGVVGVVSASSVSESRIGFVTAVGTGTFTDAAGSTYTDDTVTVKCTDGEKYTYEYDNSDFAAGYLVSVSTGSGAVVITRLSSKSIAGKVNASGTAAGDYTFADGAVILDSTSSGSFVSVTAQRLAGITLSSSNVRYYEVNDAGDIALLILSDATGDACEYGIVTSSVEKSSGMDISSAYKYIIGGEAGSYSSSWIIYNVETGPALFEFDGSGIVNLRNLTETPAVTGVGSTSVLCTDVKYTLADDVSVYVHRDGAYYLSSLAAVSDTSVYDLTAWYDKLPSLGGRVRVIIATAK